MVNKKKKSTVDLQKLKRRKSKLKTMENHQFTKEGNSREKKKQQNSHKTTGKMALVSSYLSVSTFNITVLSSLKGYCGWMDKVKHQQ